MNLEDREVCGPGGHDDSTDRRMQAEHVERSREAVDESGTKVTLDLKK